MPELREVFEMTTKQVEPDADSWREQEKRQRRANRNKKVGAFAVTAAIGVAAVAVILGSRVGRNDPAANPVNPTAAEKVATRFVEAYGAFNVEQAIVHLADDADISGLVGSLGAQGLQGTRGELRSLSSLLQAMGYVQVLDSCEETESSASETNVRCRFAFHLLGSSEFGRGPFRGSSFDLTVRDGEIAAASLSFEIEKFSPQMWEPFARWVSTTHPEDATVMYEDATYSGTRLTDRSIRLWDRRVRQYVEQIGSIRGVPVGSRLSRIVDGVALSFRVQEGVWLQFGTISINKSIVGPQGAEAIVFWTSFPEGDIADPCARLLGPSVGPTAANLAAAVSTAPGTKLVTGPSDVTLGGHPAKHVVLTVREDVGCDPGYFYTWHDVRWASLWPETQIGDTIRVWIVDVGGTLLFVEAETTEQASAELVREVQQIVGSIRFD
jgi:hypothetical protein